MSVADDAPQPDLILLDDADLGFRQAKDCWPMAVRTAENKTAWIMLKMAKPVA